MSDDFEIDGDDGGGEGFAFLRKLGVPQGADQLVLTFGIVGLLLLGLGAYWVGERFRIARGGMSDAAHIVTSWEKFAPLPIDVNGDGHEDIVGLYVGKDPGGVYLGAFDGDTTKIVWRVGPLDIERAGRSEFGRQGDLGLINEKGRGKIVQLKDGKLVAQIALPNAIQVCGGQQPSSPLMLDTTLADQPLEIDLSSRAIKQLSGRRPCIRTSAHASPLELATLGSDKQLWFALKDASDSAALSWDEQSGATLHGYKSGESEPLWSTPLLAGAGKNATPHRDGNTVDLSGGRLFVGYRLAPSNAQSLLALDARSGKELWRVPIEGVIHGVSASATRVYVVASEFLVVLDASTGKIVLDLGTGADEP